MKKARKGLTLVEVIVSIAVFTVISLALFSSVLAMRKVVRLQEDYVRIEMVCRDINAYWDAYGDEWYDKYFEGKATSSIGYLNGQFEPSNAPDKFITISFKKDASDHLIITKIYSKDRTYAENIDCGVSK